MSLPEFGPFPWTDNRRMVIQFLVVVQEFLSKLVESGVDPDGVPIFADELRDSMREAWIEIRPRFEEAEARVLEVPEERLVGYGLAGAQLEFKLNVITWVWQRYLQSGGKDMLRKLLNAIDTLLKSILGVIAVGDAIVEFKESLESSIMD